MCAHIYAYFQTVKNSLSALFSLQISPSRDGERKCTYRQKVSLRSFFSLFFRERISVSDTAPLFFRSFFVTGRAAVKLGIMIPSAFAFRDDYSPCRLFCCVRFEVLLLFLQFTDGIARRSLPLSFRLYENSI